MRAHFSPAVEQRLAAARRLRRFPGGASCARCGWGSARLARQLQRCGALPRRRLRQQATALAPLAAGALIRRGGGVLCQRCAVGHSSEMHHPAGRHHAPGWLHPLDVRWHRMAHALSSWRCFSPELAAALPPWLRAATGVSP